jgi:hypothetical protein
MVEACAPTVEGRLDDVLAAIGRAHRMADTRSDRVITSVGSRASKAACTCVTARPSWSCLQTSAAQQGRRCDDLARRVCGVVG